MTRRRQALVLLGAATMLGIAVWPFTRMGLEQKLSAWTGAAIRIQSAISNPISGALDLDNVQYSSKYSSHPATTFRNVGMTISPLHLLSNKWIIDRLTIDGADIKDFAAKENAWSLPSPGVSSSRATLIPHDLAVDEVMEAWNQVRKQLSLWSVATQISDKWQQRFHEFDEKAQSLRIQVDELNSNEFKQENPLRDVPAMQRTNALVEKIRQQVDQNKKELTALVASTKKDRQSYDEARQADLKQLSKSLPDIEASSNEAFQLEMQARTVQIIRQLEPIASWIVSSMNLPLANRDVERSYGKDYHFRNLESTPNFQIHHGRVSGEISIAQDRYLLNGNFLNLTDLPEHSDHPFESRWRFTNEDRDVSIQSSHIPTASGALFELNLKSEEGAAADWKLITQGGLKFICHGNAPEVEVSWLIGASSSECTFRMSQRDTQLRVENSHDGGYLGITEEINSHLHQVRAYELNAHVTQAVGMQPQWTISTSLREPVILGIQEGIRQVCEASTQELAKLYQHEFDQELNQLDNVVKARSKAILRRLERLGTELDRVSKDVYTQANQQEARFTRMPSNGYELRR